MKAPPPHIVLACLVHLVTGLHAAHATDLRVTPTLGVTEDITDNAHETSSHKQGEQLTVVQPGFDLEYSSPSLSLSTIYRLDYRYYAEGTSSNGASHSLALVGKFTLVDEFLKMDVTDTFSRVPLDVARDTTAESSSHNQTDQNIASVVPYVDWRLSDKTALRIGSRYSDIRYWSGEGIDRREAGGFAEISHQLTPRLGLPVRFVYTHTRTEPVIVTYTPPGVSVIKPVNYENYDLTGGFRYEYAEDSFLFGSVGNSWQYFSFRSQLSNIIWDAGVNRRFGRTVVTLESKSRYTEDPTAVSLRQITHSLRIDRALQRGTLGMAVSYDDYRPDAQSERITISPVGSGPSTPPDEKRHGVTISLTGTHEFRYDLTGSWIVTGDYLSSNTSTEYPYHLTVTPTVSYHLSERTVLNLAYTYAGYRYRLDTSRGAVDVNRVVMQVLHTF